MNPWKCVPLYLHIDADSAEVGLWCEDCQLPSVIRYPIVQLSEMGVGQVGVYEACADCGDWGDEEDE